MKLAARSTRDVEQARLGQPVTERGWRIQAVLGLAAAAPFESADEVEGKVAADERVIHVTSLTGDVMLDQSGVTG